jgi:hypothetical protein
MKFTKRLLAVALTLALALSLALPAMAAVDWTEFKITKQPQDLTIKYGDSFTLSVEVAVPEGVEVEYQWYYRDGSSGNAIPIENATSLELQVKPDALFYPENVRFGGATINYTCQATAYAKDEAGNIILPKKHLGSSVDVKTERTTSGRLYDLFIAPFEYAFGTTVALISMTYGILIPVSPLAFLFGLVFGFVEGLRGLFN